MRRVGPEQAQLVFVNTIYNKGNSNTKLPSALALFLTAQSIPQSLFIAHNHRSIRS